MPFLGVEPVQEFASVAKQTITGTGATSYSLNHSVASANDLAVFVNNVRQEPTSAYTASGGTITFTSALASTDSCYVMYIARSFQSTQVTESDISDYNPQLKAHTVQSVSWTSTSDTFDFANATASIVKVTLSGNPTLAASSAPQFTFSNASSHEGKLFHLIFDANFTVSSAANIFFEEFVNSSTIVRAGTNFYFTAGSTFDQSFFLTVYAVDGQAYLIAHGNVNN